MDLSGATGGDRTNCSPIMSGYGYGNSLGTRVRSTCILKPSARLGLRTFPT